ncbi:MAG: hypothetical protein EXR69_09710 [Myxococcales bacterium]|nr:hypothetical protein [Myxococcales bacterium]
MPVPQHMDQHRLVLREERRDAHGHSRGGRDDDRDPRCRMTAGRRCGRQPTLPGGLLRSVTQGDDLVGPVSLQVRRLQIHGVGATKRRLEARRVPPVKQHRGRG